MTSASDIHDIEAFLHAQIPITLAMGVRVESLEEDQLVLTAPLAPNHNHLGTAFGGSLAAMATLAGYAFLWLELGDREAHVVIAESTLSYRQPVTGSIRALCRRPEAAALAAFKAAYAQNGKGRICLRVTVEAEAVGAPAVEFHGTYVARRGG